MQIMKWKYFRQCLMLILMFSLSLGTLTGCGSGKVQEKDMENKDTAEVDRVVEAADPETEENQEDAQNQDGQTAAEEQVPEAEQASQTAAPAELESLRAQMQSVIEQGQALGERWAVYVEDLASGATAVVGNEQMESASLIKLFTAVTVFQHMGEMETLESYEGETLELMGRMIRSSDNDAANALVRRLGEGDAAAGMQKVNAFCQNYGFAETHMGRLMLDFNAADDNYTSVENCGRLLRSIYRKEVAGSDTILGFMKEQERTGKIPAGLPAGTESANKTGELTDVENDAAVVFSETGDYVICVMSGELADASAARSKIVELSELVYQNMAE